MNNRKAIGYITANYTSEDKSVLTQSRPLASLPFMGRYRLIDFPLSNMMNAGIKTVGVVLPTNYRSIVDHVGSGSPWGLDRKSGGMFLMPGNAFGTTKLGMRFLLRDMIANKDLFLRADEPYVVMMGTNIIFNMDLNELIDAHEQSGAGITMAYVKSERAHRNVMRLNLADDGKVESIEYGTSYGDNKFIDCFVINRDLLLQICDEFAAVDYLDLFEAVANEYNRIDVRGYEFKGMAIGMFNERSYYHRSMEMLEPGVMDRLFIDDRPIMTKPHDTPPAKYSSGSVVRNSFVSAGCRIKGTVHGSMLSRNIIVEPGAYVSDSIIMQGCTIESGARVENAIVDKNNVIAAQTEFRGTPDNILIISKAPGSSK